MSERHLSPQDRALLTDLVNGDRTENDPQVRARLAVSRGFAAEVAAIRSVTTALQQDGAVRRGEIAAAQAAVTAADVAHARAMIAQHLPRRRRLRLGHLLAAAAAVVMLSAVTWVCLHRAAASDPDPTLGTPVDRSMLPRGEVRAEQLATFRWVDATGNGSWLLAVYPARDGRKTGYEPLFPEQRIIGDEWQPTTEQIERMRAAGEFIWELTPVRDNATGGTTRAEVRCSH